MFRRRNRIDFHLSPDADAFLAAACEEHNAKNDALLKEWGFGSYSEWGFDQETALFFLELNDGARTEARGQIYGSWSKREATWEWAWNNPHAEPSVSRDAERIREFGRKEKLGYLTEGVVGCPSSVFASYLAAIGEKICDAQGVFPGSAGAYTVFIGLYDLRRKAA